MDSFIWGCSVRSRFTPCPRELREDAARVNRSRFCEDRCVDAQRDLAVISALSIRWRGSTYTRGFEHLHARFRAHDVTASRRWTVGREADIGRKGERY